jgi:hypothetical protein
MNSGSSRRATRDAGPATVNRWTRRAVARGIVLCGVLGMGLAHLLPGQAAVARHDSPPPAGTTGRASPDQDEPLPSSAPPTDRRHSLAPAPYGASPVPRPPSRHLRRLVMEAVRSFPVWAMTGRLLVTDARRMEIAWRALETEIAAMGAACDRFRADSELSRVNTAQGATRCGSRRYSPRPSGER